MKAYLKRLWDVITFFTFALGPSWLMHKMYGADNLAMIFLFIMWLPATYITNYLNDK